MAEISDNEKDEVNSVSDDSSAEGSPAPLSPQDKPLMQSLAKTYDNLSGIDGPGLDIEPAR